MNTMEVEAALQYIKEELREHPQLVHASNILGKLKKDKVAKNKIVAAQRLAIEYKKYLEKQLKIGGYSKEDIIQRVKLLNEYYSYYDNPENGLCRLFSSQGKLRSSILEEFFYFLFKDYLNEIREKVNDMNDVLGIGAAKSYTNLYFSPKDLRGFVNDPSIKLNVKDQDFAIFRNVFFGVDGNKQKVFKAKVPVVAIEVKTYIDKTMLEGAIATAEKLKMGNPFSLFIVAVETYNIDIEVDPSYSQINQIYVLRKQRGAFNKIEFEDIKPIDYGVVYSLFSNAKNHIERPWSDVKSKLERDGIII